MLYPGARKVLPTSGILTCLLVSGYGAININLKIYIHLGCISILSEDQLEERNVLILGVGSRYPKYKPLEETEKIEGTEIFQDRGVLENYH